MSLMQSGITSRDKAPATRRAGLAMFTATIVLVIMALVGVDLGVIAMIGLLVLGSILILADGSANGESHTILT
ncbi:MAG TPA: hypothetical protein VGH49_16435 [Xanthobacteraceae bacterium]|jgi:hypothetical protein